MFGRSDNTGRCAGMTFTVCEYFFPFATMLKCMCILLPFYNAFCRSLRYGSTFCMFCFLDDTFLMIECLRFVQISDLYF